MLRMVRKETRNLSNGGSNFKIRVYGIKCFEGISVLIYILSNVTLDDCSSAAASRGKTPARDFKNQSKTSISSTI